MNPLPLIIAHRGTSRFAPENTLAAFKMAVAVGAEGVEFDVRLSKDRVPVVIHDPTLERTGMRREKVSDMTAEQLADVDVGSWFNKKHPKRTALDHSGETVPTLGQVLDLLDNFDGLIYVELKADGADLNRLVAAVCGVLRVSKLLPQIIVKSFDLAAVSAVKRHLPEVTTAALFAPQIVDLIDRRRQIVDIARDAGADQVSIHRALLTRTLMKKAGDANVPVTIWTADRPLWVHRCRRLGVRALITNDPALMLAAREGPGGSLGP